MVGLIILVAIAIKEHKHLFYKGTCKHKRRGCARVGQLKYVLSGQTDSN